MVTTLSQETNQTISQWILEPTQKPAAHPRADQDNSKLQQQKA